MNCAIVGAGGFIGRSLGRHCRERGHDVVGLDVTPPERIEALGFELRTCDVRHDEISLPSGVEVVYYLAQSPFYREFPKRADHLFGVNVVGALRAAEAARMAGARLFVYTSTGTIYAPGFTPMTESRPVRRDQGYALSKVCAEEALSVFATGDEQLRVLCPRLFGVFGPGQIGAMVPAIADRVRDGRPVTIQRSPEDPSDENGLRMSLTYVDDVNHCLVGFAEAESLATSPFEALNLASDEPVSIRRLATAIGGELGAEPIFEIVEERRESDYVADITRLRTLIDPTFTPLEAAIAKTLPSHV